MTYWAMTPGHDISRQNCIQSTDRRLHRNLFTSNIFYTFIFGTNPISILLQSFILYLSFWSVLGCHRLLVHHRLPPPSHISFCHSQHFSIFCHYFQAPILSPQYLRYPNPTHTATPALSPFLISLSVAPALDTIGRVTLTSKLSFAAPP